MSNVHNLVIRFRQVMAQSCLLGGRREWPLSEHSGRSLKIITRFVVIQKFDGVTQLRDGAEGEDMVAIIATNVWEHRNACQVF
jgi:hypothetical protein